MGTIRMAKEMYEKIEREDSRMGVVRCNNKRWKKG